MKLFFQNVWERYLIDRPLSPQNREQNSRFYKKYATIRQDRGGEAYSYHNVTATRLRTNGQKPIRLASNFANLRAFVSSWQKGLEVYVVSILLLSLNSVQAQTEKNITLKSVRLDQMGVDSTFSRTIQALNFNFDATDTVLFSPADEFLRLQSVQYLNPNELSFTVKILPGFQTLGPRTLVVANARFETKATANLTIEYRQWPKVKRAWLKLDTRLAADTLQLQAFGTTAADLILAGTGLFSNTEIKFDDPQIRVFNDPQHRVLLAPDSLLVQIVMDSKTPPAIGWQRFTIGNPYALEGEGKILVRSAEAPRITGPIGNFMPDGSEYLLEITGIYFSPNIRVTTLPPVDARRAVLVNPQKINLFLTLPIQQENRPYQVALTNPDGQTALSNYFFAMAKPLARAEVKSVTGRDLFAGQEALLEVTLRQKKLERLNFRSSYEVNFGSGRFPIERFKDDSTVVVRVQIPKASGEAALSEQHFTVNEVGQAPRWKGQISAKTPPTVTYMTSNRILHPLDTLQVLLKGTFLNGSKISLDDPELAIQMIEASEERLQFKVIAGRNIAFKEFGLILEKGGVKFPFPEFQVKVQPWEKFNRFIGLETAKIGALAPARLWSGREGSRPIKSGDFILVKFYSREIDPALGEQKVLVTGFLLDSVNTIRAEAIEPGLITITPGAEIITWRFRIRQPIRAGDRIEITVSNPGRQNRSSEYFDVTRHWYEAFRGSSSILLVKTPMSAAGGKTEILKNIAFGVNWLPWVNRKFVSFDASFIVGNPSTTDTSVNVEMGFGLSAIFLNYLQIGIGTNLSGTAFNHNYLFIGGRFKLPTLR